VARDTNAHDRSPPTNMLEPEPSADASAPESSSSRSTTLSSGPAGDSGEPRVPTLVKLLVSIVAPTTLLTGLLFYFGWAHAYWFFYHFGIDSTLLGLTTQDYLLRSVDALFVPLTIFATMCLLVLWGHVTLRSRLVARNRVDLLRRLAHGFVAGGLALFVIGMAGIFYETIFEVHRVVSPFSLASGMLLIAYSSYLKRTADDLQSGRRQRSEPDLMTLMQSVGVFLLVALSLFWAATDYAAAVGESRARQFESELRGYPSAVLYSSSSLSLVAPGVEEIICGRRDAAYRFRYEGLKLLLRAEDHYFFLPEAWAPSQGAAIVIPQSDSVRLEFFVAPPPDHAGPAC
jgi:hypothetical protein